nr:putative spindle checkpoint protein [Rhizopogon roseolus]
MSEASLTWNHLFVRRKKYDTPVFQSRHPALNEYISGTVKAVADELVLVSIQHQHHIHPPPPPPPVIKDRNQVALERFIFSIRNMIEVESYDKDTSVQDAMSSVKLGQYFRSFLIKLNMIESQLGLLELPNGGGSISSFVMTGFSHQVDEASFAVVLELKDNGVPSASKDKVKNPG